MAVHGSYACAWVLAYKYLEFTYTIYTNYSSRDILVIKGPQGASNWKENYFRKKAILFSEWRIQKEI